MNALRLLTAGLLVLALATASGAREKKDDNKTKIVGTWVTEKDQDEFGTGSTFEFTKEGKMKVVAKRGGQDKTAEGTYKVDGDKLSFALTVDSDEKKLTIDIKKVSDTELVLSHKDKTVEFKRKK